MTVDMGSVVQGLIGLALAGLVADHFRLRAEVSAQRVATVTWAHMNRFEDRIEQHFKELRDELVLLGKAVAELKGQSGG